MAMKLITPPSIVTFAEADAHLRLAGDTDQQTYVEMLIAAATAHVDGYEGIAGRAFGSQTWELSLDSFPSGEILLPLGPLISVTSVKYDDSAGTEQTIAGANYDVDVASDPGWVIPISTYSWPDTIDAINAVRVRFVAGYSTVPVQAKMAVLFLVGHWFENREAVSALGLVTVPATFYEIITPLRRMFV